MVRDGNSLDRLLPPLHDSLTLRKVVSNDYDENNNNQDGNRPSMTCESVLSTDAQWDNAEEGRVDHNNDCHSSHRCVAYPQPTTLASSKFGRRYVKRRLVSYMRSDTNHCGDNDDDNDDDDDDDDDNRHRSKRRRKRNRQLSVMEYASLLGRHDIVSMMLVGGIDPTICDDVNDDDDDDDGDGDIRKSEDYDRSDTIHYRCTIFV